MTRFADQLFDDLMRDHGDGLARTTMPAAPKRHLTARPVLLTAGAGGIAVAAAVGTLVAGGGTPAYALTTHPDGTVTLAVYQQSGIAGANSKLHQLGDRVVVVPVKAGCPSIDSLPAPGVPAKDISLQVTASTGGGVTVDAHGIPAGDILVLGLSTTGGRFQFSMQESMSQGQGQGQSHGEVTMKGHSTSASHAHAVQSKEGSGPGPVSMPAGGFVGTGSKLTSGPAPSCVSIPAMPAPGTPGGPGGGPASSSSGGGPVSRSASGVHEQ
jgi:hypothetical protein